MKSILLTNDDGYFSPGLLELKSELEKKHRVWVVAPDREMSAVSMALTLNLPLRIKQIEPGVCAVNGTTSDCVNIALQKILPALPDFVVSGMNLGENLSEDVFFSGTVGGAFSAHLYGIPALAVSLLAAPQPQGEPHFDCRAGARIAARILDRLLPAANGRVVYNLNIPSPHRGEIAVTRLGRKRYTPDIIERCDPRGRAYYWIGAGQPSCNGHRGSDVWAVHNGYVSLSVIRYDLNAAGERQELARAFRGFSL